MRLSSLWIFHQLAINRMLRGQIAALDSHLAQAETESAKVRQKLFQAESALNAELVAAKPQIVRALRAA